MDRDSVGRQGEPFEMRVELGKIREFARATASDNPRFLSGECIPPTFLTADRFWQAPESDVERSVRFHPERSLQAEQEYVFPGPPPAAGDRLTAVVRVDRIYDKASRRGTLTFVDLVTEYRDPAGRLVAEGRMTGVETPPPTGADG